MRITECWCVEIGTSGHACCERAVEAESDAGEHIQGVCWVGSGKQHDFGIQVISDE